MKVYTAHLKPERPPVLLREGWSWGAALFGPLWLVAHRAWVAAALHAALLVALSALPGRVHLLLLGTLAVMAGLLGRDVLRWSLARRGYALAHVLAARDADAALGRLLAARGDLAAQCAGTVG